MCCPRKNLLHVNLLHTEKKTRLCTYDSQLQMADWQMGESFPDPRLTNVLA